MATTSNLEPDRGWAGAAVFDTPNDAGRAKRFASARRHTRLVRFLRKSLPAAAVGVMALYIGVVAQTSGWMNGLPKIALPNIIPDNLAMNNPRYEGFNADGGKYVVTAKTAI